ncbi:MAG: catechol 2,3-dioxygenase-like lactoylglutathione lyase family enzyme [Verrucomicrobiales bacterium]|jgi:catechol 2,3-dioxygenase-like lactoylglutathione lyase family enzyme
MRVALTGIDHIVLLVRDIDRSIEWYTERFEVTVERYELWQEGSSSFVSLRVSDSFLIDLTPGDAAGENVDHFAVVTDRASFDSFVHAYSDRIEMGPAQLSGAQGIGDGAYIRDPDGHRVEVRTYD